MGEFFWRGDQELLLEVRSLDRAIKALEFFEKRINPRVAECHETASGQSIFCCRRARSELLLESPYDRFFDGSEVDIPDPLELLKEAQEVKESQKAEEGSPEPWLEYLEAKFKEKIPEIEEIPLGFYRDKELGLSGLEMALTLRKIEAEQHFKGNESFRQYELIEKMTESLVELIQQEQTAQLVGTEEEE